MNKLPRITISQVTSGADQRYFAPCRMNLCHVCIKSAAILPVPSCCGYQNGYAGLIWMLGRMCWHYTLKLQRTLGTGRPYHIQLATVAFWHAHRTITPPGIAGQLGGNLRINDCRSTSNDAPPPIMACQRSRTPSTHADQDNMCTTDSYTENVATFTGTDLDRTSCQ